MKVAKPSQNGRPKIQQVGTYSRTLRDGDSMMWSIRVADRAKYTVFADQEFGVRSYEVIKVSDGSLVPRASRLFRAVSNYLDNYYSRRNR